jgi:biopolymer transport protein ExbB/TolQ
MLLFLLESLAMAEEAAPGFTLSEMWYHAGVIAKSVIITLALMSMVVVLVGIERLIAFRRAKTHSMRLAAEIVGALQKNDIAAALRVAQDEQFKSGYLTGLLKAGLAELQERQDKYGLENAQRAVAKAHAEEVSKLQKGMTILATVGSTAPFVGLFGTTFGVINAFQGMAQSDSAGLGSISAGISEALITTGVGIGVAVLGVWFFNYFNARIGKVSDELDSSEADFVQWAAKLIQSGSAQAAK